MTTAMWAPVNQQVYDYGDLVGDTTVWDSTDWIAPQGYWDPYSMAWGPSAWDWGPDVTTFGFDTNFLPAAGPMAALPPGPWGQLQQQQPRAFSPTANFGETNDTHVITIDLPGVSKEDISVDVEGDTVVVKGDRKTEEQQKTGERYHQRESRLGRFFRRFWIPEGVDPSSIRAKLSNGLLKVFMPKSAEGRLQIEGQ